MKKDPRLRVRNKLQLFAYVVLVVEICSESFFFFTRVDPQTATKLNTITKSETIIDFDLYTQNMRHL